MNPSTQTTALSCRKIDEIKVGESCTLTIVISENMVDQFAELTGDYNPLHMDSAFAQITPYRERVVHGMLTGAFVSKMIGMHLPGPGALWLSQNYEFIAPVRIGDTVQLRGWVTQKSDSQGIIFLLIEGKTQAGTLVLKGEGKVRILEEEKRMHVKDIKDCRVLVTGASRGLGAAIALKFAESGATVFLNYRNSRDKALDVQQRAKSFDGRIELVQADITTEEGIARMTQQMDHQVIDIVVLNALDNLKQASFLDQSLDDFERALDYGLRAPVRLLQRLLPPMVEQKFGRIVSILSTYSCGVPPAGFSSYIVNKKVLEAITKSIAVEYGKYNICANMVSPSMLRTDLTANTPERAKKLLEAQTPLNRLASLEEIASGVLSLCNPLNAYINGHNLVISGGSAIV